MTIRASIGYQGPTSFPENGVRIVDLELVIHEHFI
jgi:hypothetical protein